MDNDNALNSIKNNTNSPPETEEKPKISSADENPETDPNSTPEEETPKTEDAHEEIVAVEEEVVASGSEPEETAKNPVPKPILPEAPVFDPEQPLPSTEPKKKNKFLPLLIILFLLLLGACGACYYIMVYRPDLNPFKQYAPAPTTKIEPSETEETKEETAVEAPELSDSELSALIDTYFVVENPPCDYLIFEEISDGEKIDYWKRDFAWSKIRDNYAETHDQDSMRTYYEDLTYGELNKAYQNLFGTDENVSKTSETVSKCFRLNYDETKGSYYIGSGCGCVPFLRSVYEIIDNKKDNNRYLITVAVTTSVREGFDATAFLDSLDTTYPNTTNYRLAFNYDPTLKKYVLKNSEKLN